MPHIPASRREVVLNNLYEAREFGELHYFIGQVIQEAFLRNPSYATIRGLKRDFSVNAKNNKLFTELKKVTKMSALDLNTEFQMAWDIFEDEVVAEYENMKARINGHAYQKSLDKIKEIEAATMKDLAEQVLKMQAEQKPEEGK